MVKFTQRNIEVSQEAILVYASHKRIHQASLSSTGEFYLCSVLGLQSSQNMGRSYEPAWINCVDKSDKHVLPTTTLWFPLSPSLVLVSVNSSYHQWSNMPLQCLLGASKSNFIISLGFQNKIWSLASVSRSTSAPSIFSCSHHCYRSVRCAIIVKIIIIIISVMSSCSSFSSMFPLGH